MDPTGGVISVASYNDLGTGTRDGEVSEFSSRGQAGDLSTYPDISAPGDMITSSCRIYLPICSTGLDPQSRTATSTRSAARRWRRRTSPASWPSCSRTPRARPRRRSRTAIRSTAYKYSFGAPYVAGPDGVTTSFDKGAGLVDVVAAANALQ